MARQQEKLIVINHMWEKNSNHTLKYIHYGEPRRKSLLIVWNYRAWADLNITIHEETLCPASSPPSSPFCNGKSTGISVVKWKWGSPRFEKKWRNALYFEHNCSDSVGTVQYTPISFKKLVHTKTRIWAQFRGALLYRKRSNEGDISLQQTKKAEATRETFSPSFF